MTEDRKEEGRVVWVLVSADGSPFAVYDNEDSAYARMKREHDTPWIRETRNPWATCGIALVEVQS